MIWAVTLSVIRPLERVFYAAVNSNDVHLREALTDMRTYVYASRGSRWSDDAMCHMFASTMAKFDVAVGIANYRQIAVAYGRLLKATAVA
jgi:hypothetical protein